MAHDFKRFPELTNAQMPFYYLQSPHKQLTREFFAKVVSVHDGDTIRVESEERDFTFPIRFLDIEAPELKEEGGAESQRWLEDLILGEDITIQIDQNNRVGKWGRLLGNIIHAGINVNDLSKILGFSKPFKEGKNAIKTIA